MRFQKLTYTYFLENKEFVRWRLERTHKQNEYWFSFIKENPDLKEEIEKAIILFEEVNINKREFTDTDDLFQKINERISSHYRIRRRIPYYLSAVAAISLLVIVGTFFLNKKSTSITATTEQIIGETLPDGNVKLLVGEDVLVLNEDSEVKHTDGQMSYVDSENTKQIINTEDVQMNKLIVPNGKRSTIILADGSKIWINSGTELEFPSKFNKSSRDIYVNGEIYIDVSKSKSKPFIVHTATFDVEVFGTSFNVSAYDDDDETSVVLVEGIVEVNTLDNSVEMQANEMITLNDGYISKSEVNVSHYTSWVRGVFLFDGTPIAKVLKKVGRYYNISFTGIANIPDKKITGKLYLSENIDDVLSSISLLTSREYKRENNVIILKDR